MFVYAGPGAVIIVIYNEEVSHSVIFGQELNFEAGKKKKI